MRTIGNILWFLLAGLWLAISYAIAGMWPFGRVVVPSRTPGAGPSSATSSGSFSLDGGW